MFSDLLYLVYSKLFSSRMKQKKMLGHFHGIGINIMSALLGTVTPFCSCSSIPIFIGFISAGLPLGAIFS